MKFHHASFLIISFTCILASCTVIPHERPESLPEAPPERPTEAPMAIMGQGLMNESELIDFLKDSNSSLETERAERLAVLYIEEALMEGVNHDIAFVQMCLETGFLRFGGLVTPDMHNYCGLGSIGPEKPGERFPTPQIGVRAHIQHLKAYASSEPLRQELVDPRYRYVKTGSAPTILDLSGRWASDKEYGNKLKGLLERLYRL